MQQTVKLGQAQRPAFSIKAWWNAKSNTFTRLCATEPGEIFTHGQVILAHLFLLFLILMCGVAEWLEGGVL